jgi:hypothetical protein
MSRTEFLAEGRAFAEEGMVDACTIRRRTGEKTTDDVTGKVTHAYVSPDPYSGKCRVQQTKATGRDSTVAEDTVVELVLEVQLPMTVTGLQVGDEVHVTTSLTDPDLPGRVFLIRGLAHKTDATARRVQCSERTDR